MSVAADMGLTLSLIKQEGNRVDHTIQVNQLRAFGAGRSKAAPVIEALA